MDETKKLWSVEILDEDPGEAALNELSCGLEPGEDAEAIRVPVTRSGLSLLSATDTSSKLVKDRKSVV